MKLSGLALMKTAALMSSPRLSMSSLHISCASACSAGFSVFIFAFFASSRTIATPSAVTSGSPAKNCHDRAPSDATGCALNRRMSRGTAREYIFESIAIWLAEDDRDGLEILGLGEARHAPATRHPLGPP